MTEATVPVTTLVDAARALHRAARFTEAAALVASATGAETNPALALARAEVTVMADYFHRRETDPEVLRRTETVITVHGSGEDAWDLDLLRLRHAYYLRLLRHPLPEPDPARDEQLRHRAETVRDSAPDDHRRAVPELLLGWIADNVLGDRATAPAHYAAALRAGEEHGDDYVVFEALRHLGDHDHDAGDHELTRQRWQRSAFHAARAGLVGPNLLQLLLVAVSLRDRGDEAGARALATEVVRWSDAIGLDRVRDMASAFLDGVDPTAEPESD